MTIRIEASRRVAAAPAAVWAILTDYRDAHRRIVSPRAFLWLTVDEGGTGAGTRIRFALRAGGRVEEYAGQVSEPEPGRVLVEDYPDKHATTTFIVDPVDGGAASMVTIVTASAPRLALLGWLERWLGRRLLLPLYHEELQRLADLAEGRRSHDPVPSEP